MKTNNSKGFNFWRLSVFSSIVCMCNCFFYANKIIMLIVVGIEVLWLLLLLVSGKYIQYYCYYTIFMALSLEFPEFVGTDSFYGFKTIGVGPINIGVLMIFPLFICLVFQRKLYVGKTRQIDSFFKNYVFLVVVAFLMGLIHWAFNDNGISQYASFGLFINCIYFSVFVFICFLCLYLLIRTNISDSLNYLENTLLSIIMAVAATMLASLVFKNYGIYGGVKTLQICNLNMALPCCVLIIVYKNFNLGRRIPVFIASVTILLLSLMFNANGKTVLSIGVTFLLILIVLFRRNKLAFFLSLFLVPLVAFLGIMLFERYKANLFLLSIKLEQAISLISFWHSDWLTGVSQSPLFRIQEFLTIASEYIRKPWDIVLGKGYMGSVLDNLGFFGGASETTFGQFELDHRIYISMHETLNSLFLLSGMYGIYFYFKYLFHNVKAAHISFWCIIGAFWFGLFFDYSVTMSVFGITAFGLGLVMIDRNQEEKKGAD